MTLEYSRETVPRRGSRLGVFSLLSVVAASFCVVLAIYAATDTTMLSFLVAVPVLGLAALVLGLIAVIRRRKNPRRGLWMAVVGIVFGTIVPLLCAVYALFMWVLLTHVKT